MEWFSLELIRPECRRFGIKNVTTEAFPAEILGNKIILNQAAIIKQVYNEGSESHEDDARQGKLAGHCRRTVTQIFCVCGATQISCRLWSINVLINFGQSNEFLYYLRFTQFSPAGPPGESEAHRLVLSPILASPALPSLTKPATFHAAMSSYLLGFSEPLLCHTDVIKL